MERFCEQLQKTYDKINKNHHIIVVGNLNARIGNQPTNNIITNQGEPTENGNGGALRPFCTYNNLKVMN